LLRRAGRRPDPPVASGQDPDPDALGVRPIEPFQLLVADRQGLGLIGAEPGVGIVGPRLAGGLHRLLDDLDHARPPLPAWGRGAETYPTAPKKAPPPPGR